MKVWFLQISRDATFCLVPGRCKTSQPSGTTVSKWDCCLGCVLGVSPRENSSIDHEGDTPPLTDISKNRLGWEHESQSYKTCNR